MKKRTKRLSIALVCLLLLGITGCGMQKKTLFVPESVTVYRDGAQIGQVDFLYDDQDRLTEIVFAMEGANREQRFSVTCDENGNVLSCFNSYRDALGAMDVSQGYSYTYSTRGNLLSCVYKANNFLQQQMQWEYNPKNRIVSATYTRKTSTGKLDITRTLCEYDEEGKLLTGKCYNGSKLMSVTTFDYDEAGRIRTEILCNDQQIMTAKAEYSYKDGNTCVSVRTYSGNAGFGETNYVFDTLGNLVKQHGRAGNREYVYTYKEIEVPADSLRKSYTYFDTLPATGMLNSQI